MDDTRLAELLREWKNWPMPIDQTGDIIASLVVLLRGASDAVDLAANIVEIAERRGIVTDGALADLRSLQARLRVVLPKEGR